MQAIFAISPDGEAIPGAAARPAVNAVGESALAAARRAYGWAGMGIRACVFAPRHGFFSCLRWRRSSGAGLGNLCGALRPLGRRIATSAAIAISSRRWARLHDGRRLPAQRRQSLPLRDFATTGVRNPIAPSCPYVLRFYYAWKRAPCPFPMKTASFRAAARDLRRNGNYVTSRHDVASGVQSGMEIIDRAARCSCRELPHPPRSRQPAAASLFAGDRSQVDPARNDHL